jgi:guanylate kinase
MTREEFLANLPQLVQNYQPSTEALQRISHITLLMIVGPSGAGKTSILKRLGMPYVPSDTTRPKRPEEIHGEDYFFKEDYDKLAEDIKNHQYVQVVIGANGDFYGTRVNSYPEYGIAVYAVMADVVPTFRKLGFERTTTAYIIPSNLEHWMERMNAHKLDQNQLEKRMAEAKRSLAFAINDPETHFILNDELDDAVSQVNSLIGGKENKIREEYAKQTANEIYKELMST